jgi:indole-3-glycerol phosphate synthase
VFEARAAGADLVLLIVAALEQPLMTELFGLINELGMTALVETHTGDELDQNLFGSLAHRIPAGVIRVAESAVKTPADVAHYRAAGADVVLIGEALVTGDPVATLTEFLGS